MYEKNGQPGTIFGCHFLYLKNQHLNATVISCIVYIILLIQVISANVANLVDQRLGHPAGWLYDNPKTRTKNDEISVKGRKTMFNNPNSRLTERTQKLSKKNISKIHVHPFDMKNLLFCKSSMYFESHSKNHTVGRNPAPLGMVLTPCE